jgi:hypothetical protein
MIRWMSTNTVVGTLLGTELQRFTGTGTIEYHLPSELLLNPARLGFPPMSSNYGPALSLHLREGEVADARD